MITNLIGECLSCGKPKEPSQDCSCGWTGRITGRIKKPEKTIRFRLTLTVDIDLQGEADSDILPRLHQIAASAIDNGRTTGDGPAILQEHWIKTERIGEIVRH